MGYVLIGALLLGILLFVIGWLMVVVNGFQRHPVSGLLALIPGVNMLVLPSLWHRVSGWVITGFVGMLLALGAWFSGADTHLYTHAQSLGVNVPTPPVEKETAEATPQSVTHTIDIPADARSKPAASAQPVTTSTVATEALALPPVDNKPAAQAVPVQPAALTAPAQAAPTPSTPAPPIAPDQDLPANALYHIVFKNTSVSKLGDSNGQYVRIVQKDGTRREGKVHAASVTEILLEERLTGGSVTHTIKLDSIREAAIMTREKGGE